MRKSLSAVTLTVLTVAIGLIAVGCAKSGDTATSPSKIAAANKASGGAVTADQAKDIAATAAGGTALSVEQEDEDGTQVYGVLVQVGAVVKDVKVRISDGAVLKIENDDGKETGGEGENDGK